MKKSLQDQLIKAGLGNKQQARTINTAKKKNKNKVQIQSGPTEAEQKRAAQSEKDRQRNLALHAAAETKAALIQNQQLIDTNSIAETPRGMPYYFIHEQRIKKCTINERTRILLTFGQAGIVALPNPKCSQPPIDGEQAFRYCIVSDTILNKLKKRNAQNTIVWHQSSTSLNEYLKSNNIEDWSFPKD